MWSGLPCLACSTFFKSRFLEKYSAALAVCWGCFFVKNPYEYGFAKAAWWLGLGKLREMLICDPYVLAPAALAIFGIPFSVPTTGESKGAAHSAVNHGGIDPGTFARASA